MFDSYVIRTGGNHNTTTITEKRAPTDESVRILKEMENAIDEKVIARISVKDNLFEPEIFVLESPLEGFCIRWLFKINGKTFQGQFGISNYRISVSSPEQMASDIFEEIREPLLKQITETLAIEAFEFKSNYEALARVMTNYKKAFPNG